MVYTNVNDNKRLILGVSTITNRKVKVALFLGSVDKLVETNNVECRY